MSLYSVVNGQSVMKKDTGKAPAVNIDSLIKANFDNRRKKNDECIGKPYTGLSLVAEKTAIPISSLCRKTILLNFWFATCHPCIKEFNGLNGLYAKVKSDSNIIFLSVTFEKEEQIRQAREKYKLAFPVLSIDEKDCQKLNLDNGYPTNIILESGGMIKKLYTGGYSSEKEATDFILNTIYPELRHGK